MSITWITPFEAMMSAAVTFATVDGNTVGCVNGHIGALQRGHFQRLAYKISGRNFSGHHVIGENADQLVFVFRLQQGFDRAFRQLCEGVIGGGEHCEWAIAFQCTNQIRCGQGRGQCGEGTGVNRGVDDVFLSACIGTGGEEQRDDRYGKFLEHVNSIRSGEDVILRNTRTCQNWISIGWKNIWGRGRIIL